MWDGVGRKREKRRSHSFAQETIISIFSLPRAPYSSSSLLLLPILIFFPSSSSLSLLFFLHSESPSIPYIIPSLYSLSYFSSISLLFSLLPLKSLLHVFADCIVGPERKRGEKGKHLKKEEKKEEKGESKEEERDRNEGRKMSIEREERRKSDVRCSAKCNESVKSVCVKRKRGGGEKREG